MASRFKVRTLSGADADIRSALDWLKDYRGVKVRDNFFKDYRRAKTKLHKSPHIYAPFYKAFRKIRLSKFPYKIIYRIEGDTVYIVAVAHDARDDYWKDQG